MSSRAPSAPDRAFDEPAYGHAAAVSPAAGTCAAAARATIRDRRRSLGRITDLCTVGAVLMALTGCSGAGGGRIEAGTLSARLDAGDAPVVLDVRTASEFEAGHVPGAGNFPFQSTWTRRGDLPPALDTPMIVYCEHGPRAALARFGLESLGYRDVRMLSGHMAHWRKAGLPVEQGPD